MNYNDACEAKEYKIVYKASNGKEAVTILSANSAKSASKDFAVLYPRCEIVTVNEVK